MQAALPELEEKLSHQFENGDLLRRALTHKSHAFESGANGGETSANNEQLEFLGDAVLGLVVSEFLVAQYPALPEGRLSKAKARLVNADHLHKAASRLDLGRFLLLGRGEEMNGGRKKRALLANSMEALIAAIYLDGGYATAKRFILDFVVGDLGSLVQIESEVSDFKGALQELAQSRKLPAPRYRVVMTAGPEHLKVFTVEACVGEELRAQASGSSKKIAGQQAAEILLKELREAAGDDTGQCSGAEEES